MTVFGAFLIFASVVQSLLTFFLRLGVFGLLFLAFLDSSFLFLPFGNDLLLIATISSNPGLIHAFLCVSIVSVGSMLGVLLVDVIMRKAGERGLEHFLKPKKIKKLKAKMDANATWVVFGGALVPPPFPFTGVVMTAAALQYSRKKLLLTVLAGRLLRFGIEALLALWFGRQVLSIINSNVMEFVVYGIIVVAVVGSILSIVRWTSRTRSKNGGDASRELGRA